MSVLREARRVALCLQRFLHKSGVYILQISPPPGGVEFFQKLKSAEEGFQSMIEKKREAEGDWIFPSFLPIISFLTFSRKSEEGKKTFLLFNSLFFPEQVRKEIRSSLPYFLAPGVNKMPLF